MKNDKKRVLLNSIVYIFSNVAIKGLSFFLLPLYTTRLSTNEYGLTGIISNFSSLAIIIVSLDIQVAVSKFYIAYSEDKEKVCRLIGTIYSLLIISGMLFVILAFFLRNIFTTFVFGNIDYYPIICLTTITICLNCVYTVNQSLFQIMQDAKREMIFNGMLFIATFVFNYYFVAVKVQGVLGVTISSLIAYLIYIIVTTVSLRKKRLIRMCFDMMILKEILAYSVPLMPHNLASSATPLISNIIIKNNYDLGTVGSYTLASKFGVICDIVQGSINKAYTPYLFRKLKESKADLNSDIINITQMIIYINGFIFIGVSLFAKEVILVLANGNYSEVWMLVPLITTIYIVKIPYHFYIGTLFYYPETSKKIFIATLLSAVVNVLLSYFLIPKYGICGSILADIVAMIIRVFVIVFIGKDKIPIKYKASNFAEPIVIIACIILVGTFFNYILTDKFDLYIIITLKAFLYLFYCVIVFIKYRTQIVIMLRRMRDYSE